METEVKSPYNNKEVLHWLENKGKNLYGNHFKIIEADHPIIFKLIAYFLKDEATCFQYNLNLSKGILLTDPIGCGKTSLMNLMKYLAPAKHKFFEKPTRDIILEFVHYGHEVIHRYSKGKLYKA